MCKSCMARVCAAYTSCAFFQRCKCCAQSVLSTSVSLCLSCVCVGVVCSCVCMIAMVHVAPHATHVSCLVYVFMLHGTCVCQPFSGYIHVPIGVHRYAYHMALGHASVPRCPVSGESSPVTVPVLLSHVLHPHLFVMHHVHMTHAHCMCVCAMCA